MALALKGNSPCAEGEFPWPGSPGVQSDDRGAGIGPFQGEFPLPAKGVSGEDAPCPRRGPPVRQDQARARWDSLEIVSLVLGVRGNTCAFSSSRCYAAPENLFPEENVQSAHIPKNQKAIFFRGFSIFSMGRTKARSRPQEGTRFSGIHFRIPAHPRTPQESETPKNPETTISFSRKP